MNALERLSRRDSWTRPVAAFFLLAVLATTGCRSSSQHETVPEPNRGMYSYMADAAMLEDCETRQRYPVAFEADHRALERAYLKNQRYPGQPLLVTWHGRIEPRPMMDGDGTEPTVVIDQFVQLWPGETCGNPGATSRFANTYWRMTRLLGNPVRVREGERDPFLVFRLGESRVTGAVGCRRLTGQYSAEDQQVVISGVVTTESRCDTDPEIEGRFLAMLSAARSWRIEGQHLELLDAGEFVLARFEDQPLP